MVVMLLSITFIIPCATFTIKVIISTLTYGDTNPCIDIDNLNLLGSLS